MKFIVLSCAFMLIYQFSFSQGKAYALLIGANKIKQDSYNVIYPESSVAKSDEDVQKIKKMLLMAEIKEEDIVPLTGTNANRENILAQLSNFSRKLKENDVFILYFSGHGDTLIDVSKDEIPFLYDQALVTYNGYIVDDELSVIWRSYPKGVKMYNIIDACFSGEMYKILFKEKFTKMNRTQVNSLAEDNRCYKYDLTQPYNMYYVGSSAKSRTTTPFSDGSGVLTQQITGRFNQLRRDRRIKNTSASIFFESICSPSLTYIFVKIYPVNDSLSSDYIFKH